MCDGGSTVEYLELSPNFAYTPPPELSLVKIFTLCPHISSSPSSKRPKLYPPKSQPSTVRRKILFFLKGALNKSHLAYFVLQLTTTDVSLDRLVVCVRLEEKSPFHLDL